VNKAGGSIKGRQREKRPSSQDSLDFTFDMVLDAEDAITTMIPLSPPYKEQRDGNKDELDSYFGPNTWCTGVCSAPGWWLGQQHARVSLQRILQIDASGGPCNGSYRRTQGLYRGRTHSEQMVWFVVV